MKDLEIKDARAKLEAKERRIVEEWKSYDRRYPVVVGAYKPSDYDHRQLDFHRQLREVRAEITRLPKTTTEKARPVLIAIAVIIFVWLAWRTLV